MKLRTSISLLIAGFALLGCKANIWMPASMTALQGPGGEAVGKAFVQVTTCQDRATGLDSEDVLKAQQQFGYVWKGAKYCGCQQKDFEHFVEFDVPFVIGNTGKQIGDDQVGLRITKGSGYIDVGQNVRDRFAQLQESSILLGDANIRYRIHLKNDTGSDKQVYVVSAFIRPSVNAQGTPVHDSEITHPKDADYVYTLSDTARKFAMKYGYARVFQIVEK